MTRMDSWARERGDDGGDGEELSEKSGTVEREWMWSRMSTERGIERASRISRNM